MRRLQVYPPPVFGTIVSTKVRYASALAVAVTGITTLLVADGSGASAQTYQGGIAEQAPLPLPPQPSSSPLSAEPIAADSAAATVSPSEPAVAAAVAEPLSRELQCLAGAIYFEAKGESLAGQLAVGRVVVARSRSGRFPDSYCGVVYQRSQFSFVRGRSMPHIDKAGSSWKTAVRMARIADAGSQRSPAEGALFFHAKHVSPNWRLTRVARIDNHVFYR